MNEPIKIIYKFKNDNRKPQYHIYIFVGQVPKNISIILEKIRKLSLQETLSVLNLNDITELNNYYGQKWYSFFFNKYHLFHSFNEINHNEQTLATLIKKFGEEWVEENIRSTEIKEGSKYTYGNIIHRNLVHHLLRTHKTLDYIDIKTDTRINSRPDSKTNIEETQYGGEAEDEQGDTQIIEESEPEVIEQDNEMEEEELEKLYTETIEEKKDKETTSEIKKIMGDDVYEKKESKMIEFDTSKDTNIYHENLINVFDKKYVTETYIFKDDTIKTIKSKICCSIKNHPKFGKYNYIIPSRQYLWSEYIANNTYQKIMIGIKWIQRNDLLDIDSEPNENIKVYEELRGTIGSIRSEMKRFNSRIRREDEENNVLYDYDDFILNNELYMVDIYNELGKKYSATPGAITNMSETFIKIYFFKISHTEIKNIIDYLNDIQANENTKIDAIFESINTDLILENEIVNLVETVKKKKDKDYVKILKENYMTQSMIGVLLQSKDTINFKRLNLFKIFDDFIPTEKYPFVQFMSSDGKVSYKFNEKEINTYLQNKENINVMLNWFQNVSYGLSFKIKVDKKLINKNATLEGSEDNVIKFLSVNLNDLGKLDYKIQWKEEEHAVVDDIKLTYDIIRELVKVMNETSIKHKFDIPIDTNFKTAFITTIQKFEIDPKYKINHNDLSKFARYFNPYFALVIEPRKRESKIRKQVSMSKYGTYLRYKRISKYENTIQIEQKIVYYLRNYDATNQQIVNEICKQFSMTSEHAEEYLQRIIQRFPNLKKVKKNLKKFGDIPKYKSPGIDVAIQGKTLDKYKIRISGARDKSQMFRILDVLNVLIYLYSETYLLKNPKWQYLKEELKKLNNIAQRRHSVNDFVKYTDDRTGIKTMTSADKRRIGFTPEQGQSQWTRACQNSGNTQRRRPRHIIVDNTSDVANINELLKLGYKMNNATGMYERKVISNYRGKKITQTVRAVRLDALDDAGNPTGNDIYYTCSPEENGIHIYVGFLTKSKNPNGEFMPCCFKKDQYLSRNEEKRNFFLKCIGQLETDESHQLQLGDQLYILQDTNKIHNGRIGFLPKIVDFYLNTSHSLKKYIVQHYLVQARDGYYFKFGIDHSVNSFLSAIANILDMSINNVVKKVIDSLEKDKFDMLFTSLNNGDIKSQFKTIDAFITYLKDIKNISYNNIHHVISQPSVITADGLCIIIFQKIPVNVRSRDETFKIREDCNIICPNYEETENILTRECILLYKDNEEYYPIYCITKKDKDEKNIQIQKTFHIDDKPQRVIENIKDFYFKNCMSKSVRSFVDNEKTIIAKTLYKLLVNKNVKNYLPKYQCIDTRNKCRYLITTDNTIIPTQSSGAIYNLQISNDITKFYDNFENTLNKINKFNDVFGSMTDMIPIGVKYTNENFVDALEVIAIKLKNGSSIPTTKTSISINQIITLKLVYEYTPFVDDVTLWSNKDDKKVIIDDRIRKINYDKFFNESYELFKFTFSDMINKSENTTIKNKILKIISSETNKIDALKSLIFSLTDETLYNLYTETNTSIDVQTGGRWNNFVNIIDDAELPQLDNYAVKNIRNVCNINDKDACSSNPHCRFAHKSCMLSLTRGMLATFVGKLCSELSDNGIKAKEILQIDDFYVTDVVNSNYYTERPNQKIIKTPYDSIKDTIDLFFGKSKVDLNKKNKYYKPTQFDTTEIELNNNNPMKDFGDKFIQNLILDNNTILRAYANGYYWLKNPHYNKTNRNLGYYSKKQTDIMIYIKSIIIEWALDEKNKTEMNYLLDKFAPKENIHTYITKLSYNIYTTTSGDIELNILNKIIGIPIIVYDGEQLKDVYGLEKNKVEQNIMNSIVLQIDYIKNVEIPTQISVIYNK